MDKGSDVMDRSNSDRLHAEAQSHLVGGVNSPVRAFKSVHGNPIYFEKVTALMFSMWMAIN